MRSTGSRPLTSTAWLLGACLVLGLAACRVGTDALAPAPTPWAGATSAPEPGGLGGTAMTAAEQRLAEEALTAINARRAARSLPPLQAHAGGAKVAHAHSRDMAVRGYFEHVNPAGLDGSARIAAAGIRNDPGPRLLPANFAGENLAMGTNMLLTGQAVTDLWIRSPGHATQIVAPQRMRGAQTMPAWTHCGVGVHQAPGGRIWWTAVFLRNPSP